MLEASPGLCFALGSWIALLFVVVGCGTQTLEATELLSESPGLGGSPPPVESEPPPPETIDPPTRPANETLTVAAGTLRDPCGNPLLLRGVSERVVLGSLAQSTTYISEIAQTGANALRVVWQSDADPSLLSEVLDRVAAERMVAVVEFQDRNELPLVPALNSMVDGWTQPMMLSVLDRHRKSTILELGTGVPRQATPEWEDAFTAALARLRSSGLEMPIAIRAPVLMGPVPGAVAALSRVISSDSLQNSLVATFFWSGDEELFAESHRAIQAAGMVPFIAEFSGFHSGVCQFQSTDVGAILDFSDELRVGWFAWSWGGYSNVECPALDMSEDGTLAGLSNWGRTVALAHPSGISRTSVRVPFDQLECPL